MSLITHWFVHQLPSAANEWSWREDHGSAADGDLGEHIRSPMDCVWGRWRMVASTKLNQLVRWALRACWPKVLVENFDDSYQVPLRVVRRTASLYEARNEVGKYSSNNYFKPPFQVTLAQYGGDIAGDAGENSDCGALVHIQISYMISDGYCSVPLLNDLAQLVAAAEGSAEAKRLPFLPSMISCQAGASWRARRRPHHPFPPRTPGCQPSVCFSACVPSAAHHAPRMGPAMANACDIDVRIDSMLRGLTLTY